MFSSGLRTGYVVGLEYKKSMNELLEFRTVIEQNIDDEIYFVLAPMHKGVAYAFEGNQNIKMVFTKQDESGKTLVYSTQVAVINKYQEDGIPCLKLKRKTDFKKSQRRSDYRVSFTKEVPVELELKDNAHHENVLTKDISAGGMRGIVRTYYPMGTMAKIMIQMDEEEESIDAIVVDSSQLADSMIKYEIRFKFINLNSAKQRKIMRFINTIQSERIRKTARGAGDKGFINPYLGASDKREYNDPITKWLDISVVLSWVLAFIVFINFMYATPEYPKGIQRYWGYQARRTWDLELVSQNFYVVALLFLVASISLFLNTLRMKRSTDYYRKSLIIFGGLSLFTIIIYFAFSLI